MSKEDAQADTIYYGMSCVIFVRLYIPSPHLSPVSVDKKYGIQKAPPGTRTERGSLIKDVKRSQLHTRDENVVFLGGKKPAGLPWC